MKQSPSFGGMNTQLPASLEPEVHDFLVTCEEARVEIEKKPSPLFTHLRGIIVRGKRYADKGAACSCTDLRLFIYAGYGYTVCSVHGMQDVGYLSPEMVRTNGRKAHQEVGHVSV